MWIILLPARDAYAVADGVNCDPATDNSNADDGVQDSVSFQLISNGVCVSQDDLPLAAFIGTSPATPLVIFTNTNNDGTPAWMNGMLIQYDPSITNFQLDGVAYASNTPILVSTADAFSQTVTYTYAGQNFQFQLTKAAGTDTLSGFTISETSNPTVAIQNAPASVTDNSPFNVTFEFSENVTDFTLADITVGNGSVGNFVTVDGNTYTADITPDGNGDITIDVAAAVAQDAANNDNDAATQVSVTYDATAPTVSIQNAPASVTSTTPFNVTFEFSEDVTDFTLADITVANGAASNFVTVDGNTYTADITPDGNGDITIDVAAAVAQDAANNDNLAATQAVVTFPKTDEKLIQTRTKSVVRNFMSRRADQITASDPTLVDRLSRRNNAASGRSIGGVGFSASGDLRNNTMRVGTSLRQMMATSEANKAKGRKPLMEMMSYGQQSSSSPMDENGFDVWVQGALSHIKAHDNSESEFGLFYIGADYRINSNLLVGVVGQLDWTDEENNKDNFSAKGKGWMVGPYAVAKLNENLYFDGRAAWGNSKNKVSPFSTYTDSFDANRWLARGNLTGQYAFNGINFQPHVGVIYFKEKQKAYTDSNGVDIASQTVSLGRVTFGPKISTTYKNEDGTAITPHLGLKGIWDFNKAEQVDIATGIASGSSDNLRARLDAGVSVDFTNGWSLTGNGFYDGIGTNDLKAYGGSASLKLPLN